MEQKIMVIIPESNFLKMAALSLVGSFAIFGWIEYGVVKLADRYIFKKS